MKSPQPIARPSLSVGLPTLLCDPGLTYLSSLCSAPGGGASAPAFVKL
jgi:hypothetical protein